MARPAPHPATTDRRYTAEEAEFLAAVQAFQRRTGRKFLLHSDYLHVARDLGYAKPPADPPGAGYPAAGEDGGTHAR